MGRKKSVFGWALALLLMVSTAGAQYRATPGAGKFEKKRLKITAAERDEFRGRLGPGRAGIVKLWNNPCANEPVVRIDDAACLGRTDIAFGSHYSFFTDVYLERFQQINYPAVSLTQGEFVVKNHAGLIQMLVDLGERELPAIDERTDEVRALLELPVPEGRDQLERLRGGFEAGALRVSDRRAARVKRTFLLRSQFSFGIRSLTAVKRETLFAFQVVRQQGELLTVLWKDVYAKDV